MFRYKYTPLDSQSQQIRLMSLAPGMFDDDIYLSLKTVALTQDDPPEYEALSYTWGSAENCPEVGVMPHIGANHLIKTWKPLATLNTKLSGRLAVTQNLAQALRYLRSPAQSRTLWIDAICINQKDVKEREQQVERMGDIYRSARQVFIWLGPSSHDSALAIETLNSLGRSIEVDWGAVRMQPKASADTDWANLIVPFPYDEDTWRSINGFLERSWFKRLWIWQEVLLARKAEMHCGYDSIDWHTFCQAIFCINHKLLDRDVWVRLGFPCLIDRISDIGKLARPFSWNLSMQLLLKYSGNCECLDPRDKMNALLHLLWPSDRAVMPKPNYTHSPYRIFQEVILRFMKHHGELDLLCFCEWDGESLGKPSWVPDWSRHKVLPLLFRSGAGRGSQTKARYMGKGLLKVVGQRTAEISIIKRNILQNDEDPMWDDTAIQTARWIRAIAKDLDIHLPYITGGRTIDAFSCTLFMDNFAERFVPAADIVPSVNEIFTYVRDVLRDPFEESESVPALSWNLLESMYRRRLFVSKEGHIGLVPKEAMDGDIVCVILGCKSPLLFRPLANGNHTVVGECYIQGLMNGEALLGPLSNGWESVLIGEEDLGYYDGFHNADTGERSFVDPRLGSLPPAWILKDPRRGADRNNWFVNNQTGAKLYWPQDPRMTAEALEAQGVPLQDFILE
ncbi:MAG: hypothetical protein Q9195_007912 [Heterodermia aff. obscurata]